MAKRDLGDVAVTALTRPGVGSALLAALGRVRRAGGAQHPGHRRLRRHRRRLQPGCRRVPRSAHARERCRRRSARACPFALGVFIVVLAARAGRAAAADGARRHPSAARRRDRRRRRPSSSGSLVAVVLNLSQADPGRVLGGGADGLGRNVLDACDRCSRARSASCSTALIVVPLAALLLWGWLQSHPPKTRSDGRSRRGLNFSAKLGYP